MSWVLKFTHWYNDEHKHSKLRFVTLHQSYTGQDQFILANRKERWKQLRPEIQNGGENAKFETSDQWDRQR
jgi:hypothetical protein